MEVSEAGKCEIACHISCSFNEIEKMSLTKMAILLLAEGEMHRISRLKQVVQVFGERRPHFVSQKNG